MIRCKIMRIPSELILSMFKGMDGQRMLKVTGLPEDAKVISMGMDWRYNAVVLILESKEFPEIPESNLLPRFEDCLQLTMTDVTQCDASAVVE